MCFCHALAQSAPAPDYNSAPPPVTTPTGFRARYIAGDWSLTVGASGTIGPSYEGADNMGFTAAPMISLARAGAGPLFTSRNDNPGLAVYDTGWFRIGPVGKILFTRDNSTSNDLRGLRSVPWGVEAGAFVDIYPTDWLRLRAELRQGIRAHHGLVGDLAADTYDITPVWRISGGPRMSIASSSYYRAYYGVTQGNRFCPDWRPIHRAAASNRWASAAPSPWRTTDKMTTSAFGEYSRLTGPAAKVNLVKQRGSVNQLMFGLSATYRFDFTL